MLVRDFLESAAERTPSKIALVCAEQRFTYGELDSKANRLAQALALFGVERGDRVVIHLPNSVEAVVSIFAVLKVGGVFVPVNPTTKAHKLNYIVNNCGAKVLISDSADALFEAVGLKAIIGFHSEGQTNAPQALLNYHQLQSCMSSTRPVRTNAAEDLACLIYTSGSTGQPKGVMCEHRNVVFASGSIIQYLENSDSDVVLNVLPLSFDYGLYQLLMTFRFGGTLVLENSGAFPSLILERIVTERVTGFPGVPTLFMMLLRLDLDAYDLSSLRYLTNTAAALPPGSVLTLQRKFPQAKVFSMYGLTETKRALYLPPEGIERLPGSVGIPIPGTQAWVENEKGQRLPPGEIGELVIRGPHVMRGYWADSDATLKRFPTRHDGERVCCTGDLFRQDEAGFFYFIGRKDDIIKSRGEKVAPKEIENVLYELPGIVEAAVIGVPDPICGQAIKAFIVCHEPIAEMTVLAHCRERLEDFMMPKLIEFRESLPKNASGKIDKLSLTKNLAAKSAIPVPMET
jgi:long-chain acyl-CoA synthetase